MSQKPLHNKEKIWDAREGPEVLRVIVCVLGVREADYITNMIISACAFEMTSELTQGKF